MPFDAWIGRVRTIIRRVAADQNGVAAVEAALTLPFLVFLLMGMMEMYFYTDVSRRVTTAAELTADLVTQQSEVSPVGTTGPSGSTQLSYILEATKFMLLPYATSASNPTVDVASIMYAVPTTGSNNLTCSTNSTACTGIDWEATIQGASATASGTNVYKNFSTGCTQANPTGCYCTLDATTLGGTNTANPSCLVNQSVIYVQLKYTYSNLLSFFEPVSNVFTATAFLKPRTNASVPICTTSSATSCE